MTKLLEEVIRKASTLPPERQDHYAAVLLEKMDQDEQWEATLHSQKSLDLLDEWAAEALADRREGRSEPLQPDRDFGVQLRSSERAAGRRNGARRRSPGSRS